ATGIHRDAVAATALKTEKPVMKPGRSFGRFPAIQAIAGLVVIAVLGGCLQALRHDPVTSGEWPSYGNDLGGSRYSPLAQIDRAKVGRWRVAWPYRTGEVEGANPRGFGFTAFEAPPLMIDGTLYFSTPYNRVIALDAETGRERWRYDPEVDRTRRVAI